MIFQFNKKQSLAVISIIFLATQILGLYTAVQYDSFVKQGIIEPAFDNPESVSNSFYLFIYILVMTLILILLIKVWKKVIRVIEAMAIFFTAGIVFSFLYVPIHYSIIAPFLKMDLPILIDLVPITLAFVLTIWKMIKPNHFKQNIALIFSVAGAGAVIGTSMDLLPIMIFILILSVYDFISVFITKHMIYMAKAITETPTAFTAAIPCKQGKFEHVYQLGGGDLVMPLVISSSVLINYGFKEMLFTSAGSFIALMILFYFVMKKPIALPALPPICAGSLIGFAIGLII